jgi:uncharacterized 2Fe-2S/4Fe-4S cluster protein (DUF4445 family)
MLELGALDESGYLEDGSVMVGGSVSLTQRDIRMLQLAKSAICAGLVTLACECGISLSDVPGLYIAGGFGSHLNTASAAAIGLIPESMTGRVKILGNSALAGAARLLLDRDRIADAQKLAANSVHVPLSGNSRFNQNFMNAMLFGEDDLFW